MTEEKWVKRAKKVPTLAEINAKVAARLEFFEKQLREKGYYLVAGAELEFFALGENQSAWKGEIDKEGLALLTRSLKEKVPLLERIYQETNIGSTNEAAYEAVLGTTGKIKRIVSNDDSFSCVSKKIAEQLCLLKDILPQQLHSQHGINALSFSAAAAHLPKATAGLHINLSLFSKNKKNLFVYASWRYSALSRSCANRLVTLQKEGLPLYFPTLESYMRVGRNGIAPYSFRVGEKDVNPSVSQRDCTDLHRQRDPFKYHIEDRLAGADANPYFAMLASVGAIWDTVVNNTDVIRPSPEYIMRPGETFDAAHARALRTFEKSELLHRILGEDLHKDLVAYLKSQAQGQAVPIRR